MRPTPPLIARWIVLAGFGVAAATALAVETDRGFRLVPEMEDPPGIVAAPRAERDAMRDHAEAARGLETLRAHVRAVWPSIRDVDLVSLSRFHTDATRGHRLAPAPGTLEGRPIGRDADAGTWYLELKGPRLPARFDAVHRHLHVYARWHAGHDSLDNVTVTIRTRVFE